MQALIRFADDPDLARKRPLAHAGRVIWERLPALLALDAALVLAAMPALMLGFGGAPFAAIAVATLVTAPVWAGIVAMADRMIRDEAVTLREFPGMVRDHAARAIAIAAVPAAVATLILLTFELTGTSGGLAALLLAETSLAIIVLTAMLAVFSLGTTGGLTGWPLWRASTAVVAASPVATVGLVALLVLLVLLAQPLGLVVFMVAPAPFAVVSSAMTWATVDQYHDATPGNLQPDAPRGAKGPQR